MPRSEMWKYLKLRQQLIRVLPVELSVHALRVKQPLPRKCVYISLSDQVNVYSIARSHKEKNLKNRFCFCNSFCEEVHQSLVVLVWKQPIIFHFFSIYPSVKVSILTDSDIGWDTTSDIKRQILLYLQHLAARGC